jgi:N6-adenosine-specific RNA methylase IME4
MPDGSTVDRWKALQEVRFRGNLTETSWEPPDDMSLEEWLAAGEVLGKFERSVQWWLGDWWVYGEHRYGDRTAIVTAPEWVGPSLKTCKNVGSVCRAFERSRRRDLLSFSHHAEVAGLDAADADAKLDQAVAIAIERGKPPSTNDLRQIIKRDRRATREKDLGAMTEEANRTLGSAVYSVILADPPWRYQPWSRESGMDRSADNHYPTMDLEDICELDPPAAANCALFLWATSPMLREALRVMESWGFEYRTHMVWTKPTPGTGYWFRNAHELLLLGIKGEMPAPAPGMQRLSWFQANRGRHSEKPDCVYTIIEQMFPSQPKLEMFARKTRDGWANFGNEVAG